ncbi:unnamed protein product [Miscanthus lutarioriparius]|uniref:MATH domain-containing protein n=1 Tax=Miscanthus lutarioriparius TaxID=422564 RepID=A0A811N638_9POAL|nr:unnamed protein product [Miscanthus lutarioriparius]
MAPNFSITSLVGSGKEKKLSSSVAQIFESKNTNRFATMPNLTDTEVARSMDLLLKVEGHSETMAMSDGEFITSKKRSVGGHDWAVHLRPKDHWAGRHRPVTLKLVLLSEARGGDVKAKLSCHLVDPAGRLEPSEKKSISHKFCKSGDFFGPLEVTARDDLVASGYLADDSYTVQCRITVDMTATTVALAEQHGCDDGAVSNMEIA